MLRMPLSISTSTSAGSMPGRSARMTKRSDSSLMSTRGAHWLVTTDEASPSLSLKNWLKAWRISSGKAEETGHCDELRIRFLMGLAPLSGCSATRPDTRYLGTPGAGFKAPDMPAADRLCCPPPAPNPEPAMPIQIGDPIPEVVLKHIDDGIQAIDTPT